jgi:uncharacterized repeat protein (TIGR04042 family)
MAHRGRHDFRHRQSRLRQVRRLLVPFEFRETKTIRLRRLNFMPEVLFTVELPDGAKMECYSPSTVVREYFSAGESLPVSEFLLRSRKAYAEASERVRSKFGFSCSSASAQLADIERTTRAYPAEALIQILDI